MCDKNLLVARGPLRRRQTRQGMQVPTQHLSGGSTGDASGAVPTTGLPGAGGVMPCTSSSGMMLGVYESLCDTCDAVFFSCSLFFPAVVFSHQNCFTGQSPGCLGLLGAGWGGWDWWRGRVL